MFDVVYKLLKKKLLKNPESQEYLEFALIDLNNVLNNFNNNNPLLVNKYLSMIVDNANHQMINIIINEHEQIVNLLENYYNKEKISSKELSLYYNLLFTYTNSLDFLLYYYSFKNNVLISYKDNILSHHRSIENLTMQLENNMSKVKKLLSLKSSNTKQLNYWFIFIDLLEFYNKKTTYSTTVADSELDYIKGNLDNIKLETYNEPIYYLSWALYYFANNDLELAELAINQILKEEKILAYLSYDTTNCITGLEFEDFMEFYYSIVNKDISKEAQEIIIE